MLKQLLQDSDTILRRPTVKSFQQINVDNWQWAFIYLAIGAVVAILISLINVSLIAPTLVSATEQENLKLAGSLGSSYLAFYLTNILKPSGIIVGGILSLFLEILFLILLPYWSGQALGGSKGFGNFAYKCSLFITPITVLSSVIALSFSRQFPLLSLFLSLALDVFCIYVVYVNLQGTMGLSKGKSAFAVFVSIMVAAFLFCALTAFVAIGALTQ